MSVDYILNLLYNGCGDNMDQQKVGKFISLLRKENGLTQQELAEKLGVTDKAVSKWERGLGCPDISLLVPISEIFDVSINELLAGEKREELASLDLNQANKEIIEYSSNEIKVNKKKNRNLKFSLSVSVTVLILILLCFGISAYKKASLEKETSEYINRVESYMKELGFKKDNPLRSPNSILTIDGVTYVVPKVTYKPNSKNEIFKEMLSYSDYENLSGLIVYYNGSETTVYKYENIGSPKTNIISIDFNKKGQIVKDKKYGEKEKQFYKDNEDEILERAQQIVMMWHNIYDN